MSKKVKFDGQVFNRGLLINKRGIQLANRLACDFQAQPKITELDDLTKRSQVKLAFSTKPKDAFLLKNHVDPRTVDSKYDNWIFDIDDKSLPVYLAILCPHAELVFEKIKPSEELNDLIKDSLESNNPYDKLMDIFKSHGYFLYEKVIFGYKLSKVCYLITKNGQESNTKFIDFNDFTACNDILNEWENLIRPYFDVSYLTLINGNTVKKDNLQEWVSNLKSNEPLQVIDLKLFPLYQIIDKSLQEEIELILGIDDQTKVLKVKERVLITGTVSISASTHYYRVRFPETLKSSNYKIFGKLVSQNNPVDSAVIKFQSTSISGFSVIIENFNIAEDSQIVWILIGLPSEIGYYSRDTRKIRLLSLNDNQFKYEKNLSIPLEVPKNLPAGSIICTNIIYPPSGCKTKITPNIQSNHDQTEINISIDGEKKSHCDNNNNEYAQNYNDNEEYLLQWCIISLPENQIRITPYLNTIAQPIYTGFKKGNLNFI
ncbi:hsp70 family protein [Gigaspora margarita]|uniref:Hsp70 family protein n=1 Tax=Gigaspora margarita TaxID=4874 RepID=A0A8H3XCS9_GIGMA|nr:hsp70 family protein [Gigaspora margarita]